MHADNFLSTSDPRHCCPRCDIPAVDRLNYFTGQFLAERDFRAEQDYHVGKHRNHNRYLHGWGAVCGLKVVPHPNDKCPDRVIIEPGLAVDCCGREIVVPEPVCVDLAKALGPTEPLPAGREGVAAAVAVPAAVVISLCYRECCGERVPALYSECGCGEDGGLHASRVHESFDVNVERFDPAHPPAWLKKLQAGSVKMKWSSTLGVDRATSAALSPDGSRLYVITDAESGVLQVYDAATGVQVAAKPLMLDPANAARALDVAASPDGASVYVLCRPANAAAAQVEHSLLVVDAADLTKAATRTAVGNAPLAEIGNALACGSSGEIFILLVAAATGSQFFQAPAGGTSPPVAVATARVVAMSLTPAGSRVFLAPDSGNAVLVYNRATQTVVTAPIDIAPRVLAVTEDETTLLASDGAAPAELRAYETTAAGVKPTGKTASLGATESVAAIAAGNDWAFVVTRSAAGAGNLSAVDLARLAAGAADSVIGTVPAAAEPREVVLAADGGRAYVVGHGVHIPGAANNIPGGVSVVDITGGDCSEILWRQLDGCPECEVECVPLAKIIRWTPGRPVTAPRIDNRIRPLLPSTNTLRDLILCCCGRHEAPDPVPETRPVQPPALVLTRLVALSWRHNARTGHQAVEVKGLVPPLTDLMTSGLVIGFDGDINPTYSVTPTSPGVQAVIANPDVEHVFQVLLRHPELEQKFTYPITTGTNPISVPMVMRFPLTSHQNPDKPPFVTVVPVRWKDLDNDGLIDDATYVAPTSPTEKPNGLAYLFHREVFNRIKRGVELWVRVNGDFIFDVKDRPVDLNFVRFALRNTDDTVQPARGGGVFESWFTFKS